MSLKILNGTSDVSFSVGTTPNSQDIIGYSLSGQQSVIICPSDPRFANTLTFFIDVFCPQLGVTYEFEVIVNVINTTFSPPPSISEVNFITTTERVCISSDYDIQNSSFSFEEITEICEEILLVFPLVESSCRFLFFFIFSFLFFFFFFFLFHFHFFSPLQKRLKKVLFFQNNFDSC